MVAGDEADTVGGPQGAQAPGLGPHFPVRGAVHQVPGHRHQVRGQGGGGRQDVVHLGAAHQGPQVQVRDLHDAEAVQPRRQVPDGHLHAPHRGRAQGRGQARQLRAQGGRRRQGHQPRPGADPRQRSGQGLEQVGRGQVQQVGGHEPEQPVAQGRQERAPGAQSPDPAQGGHPEQEPDEQGQHRPHQGRVGGRGRAQGQGAAAHVGAGGRQHQEHHGQEKRKPHDAPAPSPQVQLSS